jgi:hypothetical protein
MVMNNNAHRLKYSCLCAFHVLTAYPFHNNRRLSTNKFRYTSILLPDCFGLWISTCIIIVGGILQPGGGKHPPNPS